MHCCLLLVPLGATLQLHELVMACSIGGSGSHGAAMQCDARCIKEAGTWRCRSLLAVHAEQGRSGSKNTL
jgi:hypothetical protein